MKEPDKINAIQALAPLNVYKPFTAYMATFAVAFYNQVSIYGFQKGKSNINLILDIFVQDIEEDIICQDYDETLNLLAFAGKLGVGYIYEIGPSRKIQGEVNVDQI
jgi:hypothetical protein